MWIEEGKSYISAEIEFVRFNFVKKSWVFHEPWEKRPEIDFFLFWPDGSQKKCFFASQLYASKHFCLVDKISFGKQEEGDCIRAMVVFRF